MPEGNEPEPDNRSDSPEQAHRLPEIDHLVAPAGISSLAGSRSGEGLRIAFVCSRYNLSVSRRLLDGALRQATARGVDSEDLTVAFVPGAYELPLAAQALAESEEELDAIVCLGSVIRGETPHFEFVAGEAAHGCARVQLDTGMPVVFGVLTTETLDQALARSGGAGGDKGAEALDTAIEMATLLGMIDRTAPAGGRPTSQAR